MNSYFPVLIFGVVVAVGLALGYQAYLDRLRAASADEALLGEAEQPSVPGIVPTVLLSLEAIRAEDQTGTCTRVIEILAVLSAAGVRRELLHAAGQAGALTPRGIGWPRPWWTRRWPGWPNDRW